MVAVERTLPQNEIWTDVLIAYLFEDLYIWMLEEIRHLERKGVKIVPICIRPRSATTFSAGFLGDELSRIADRTIYLHESLVQPKIWIRFGITVFFHPLRMFGLFVQLCLRSLHEFKFRDWRVFVLFPQLLPNFNKADISIIQVHFASYACTYAYFVSRIRSVNYYVTVHAADIFLKNTLRKEKLFGAKRILSIDRYNKEFLIDLYGSDIESRIVVNYTGTDLSAFRPVERIQTDPFTIMSLAILVEHKGLRYLLEACRILKEKGRHFVCNVYGNGPELPRLREYVKTYGLEDKVRFHGIIAREELVHAFHASSVFVLPSVIASSNGLREGIPQVFKECMACGIPAISTYTGGIPEIIDNGKTGFLVHERDAPGLAQRLLAMMEQPDLVQRMSVAAREKVERQFNIDTHTDRMIDILELRTS